MCYPVMRRDYLDLTKPNQAAVQSLKTQNRRLYNVLYDIVQVLASLLFNRAEKELLIMQKKDSFFRFVQKYYYPATMHSRILVQGHF